MSSEIVETNCVTCESVDKFTGLANSFTTNLADALENPIRLLFVALLGLWVVISGYKLSIRPSALPEIIQEFLFIGIASALVAGHSGASGLISSTYEAALSIMGGASEVAFKVAAGNSSFSSDQEGMARLMAVIENIVIAKVFKATIAIISSGSALNPMNWLYAVIFVLPYMLLLFMYFAKVVVAMFRVLLIAVFSPFLCMCFAFNWGRPMAVSGLRTLLSSIMVLFAATAAVSITLYGVQALDFSPDGIGRIKDFASIENPNFVLAIILGWLGTALMTEGVAIANSITGSLLTNTAAGIITAGLGGSTMSAANMARNRIVSAAAPGVGHLAQTWSKMNPAVAEMVARYKSGGKS